MAPPVIPDHTLIRGIGAGAYGEVWLARSSLGTLRAVKLVRRADFDDDRPYEREFAGLQKFEPLSRTHEGFVDLLHVGRNDAEGWFYYVMELADAAEAASVQFQVSSVQAGADAAAGASPLKTENLKLKTGPAASDYSPLTLAALVKSRGARPLDECLAIARTLTSALAELHGHGLVHRDIKPSNIVFVGGVPKLADVGLVAAARGVGQDRSFVGTEGFIPPEGPGTAAADLYSLGIVLYVLGTGQSHRDFPEPPADLATRPDRERERWLEFSTLIHRACQADPHDRYASAAELLADVERLAAGGSVRRHRAWRQRRRVALACVAAVAVVAGGYWGNQSLRRGTPIAKDPVAEMLRTRGTTNQEAYNAYQLGRFHFSKLNLDKLRQAEEHFRKAIELDPAYVAAHAGLVETYTWGLANHPEDYVPRVRELAEKLIRLAPERPEGHSALGIVQMNAWNWDEAEKLQRRAIQLNPDYLPARFHLALLHLIQCRFTEAEAELRRGEQLDPTALEIQTANAWLALGQGDFPAACARLRHALELEPNSDAALNWLVMAYEAAGDYENAIALTERSELSWNEPAEKVAAHVESLRRAFRDEGAAGYWRTKLDHGKSTRRKFLLDQVTCHARLGQTAEALALLERMTDDKDLDVFWLKFWSKWRFPGLAGEPRFQALLRRVGLEQQ